MKYIINKQLPPQVGVALFLLLLLVAYYKIWHIPNEKCLGSGWENLKIGFTLATGETPFSQATVSASNNSTTYPLKLIHLTMMGYIPRKDRLTNLQVCEVLQEFRKLDTYTPWTNYVQYIQMDSFFTRVDRLSLEHALYYPYAVVYERTRLTKKGEKWVDITVIGSRSRKERTTQ